jgi:hypothetical protein
MTANTTENPGCLSKIFPFLKPSPKITSYTIEPSNEYTESETLPYRVRDDFLSPAEFSFYKVLSSILNPRFVIQSKVRLADIFFVARPNQNLAYLSRIAQRHIDFLVCDSTTMQPILGIELDDASHKNSDRQERDEFLGNVFEAARLSLCRVPAQRAYNTRDIEDQLAPYLKIEMVKPPSPDQPILNESPSPARLCPKCGIPMVLRTVGQGEHKGKQFYGCKNYPNCRQTKPVVD